MNLRQYITIMLVGTVLCWSAWFFVIVNVNPFEAGTLSFLFFYISLFLALLGTFSVLIFVVYRLFSRTELPLFRYVERSFRESFILSAICIFLLFLRGVDLLNIWNFSFFIVLLILLFSFSFSTKRRLDVH